MRGARFVASVAVVLLLSGCADKRVTLQYQTPSTLQPIAQAPPLTIYGFNDRRGDEGDNDPRRVGGIYGGYGNRLSKVTADGPLMLTLLNAQADAFRARGVPVTVVIAPFSPGSGTVHGHILSGDLKNFSTEARFTNSAHISGIVRLYAPTGAMLVEKELSERVRSDQGGGGGVLTDVKDLERIMNETLSKFVERVVNDPEIVAQLRSQ
jgi:uncharacterized lipoprotein YajG